MNVKIIEHKRHVTPPALYNGAYFDNEIGFWGTVTAVNSQLCTCDVVSNLGLGYKGLPITSTEWANFDKSRTPHTGSRNLPSVGSTVFVLKPYENNGGAFVLCSAQGAFDGDDFLASDEDDAKVKDTQSERTTQGGWNITQNYTEGNLHIANKQATITIDICPAKNDDTGDEQGIKLTAFDNIIEVDKDGNTKITIAKKLTSEVKDSASKTFDKTVTITTKDAVTLTCNKAVAITAKDTVSLKCDKAITIEGTKTEKLDIKNSAGSLGKVISDLLNDLAQLQTVGSPAAHTGSPAFISQMQELKTTWDSVFVTN